MIVAYLWLHFTKLHFQDASKIPHYQFLLYIAQTSGRLKEGQMIALRQIGNKEF